MKCPKCNQEILENSQNCLNCGTNLLILKKTIAISNKLYNKALYLANKKELYFAIDILEKSLFFNKKNINARNLLGLLYYKIGHFAIAIEHFIISSNYDNSSKNLANKYINYIKQNMHQFEKLNDAVILYNQALKYLKQKDDDLALIRIKNALKIFPTFIDALNLLAICYIIQNNNKKAIEVLNMALSIDITNKKSLYYLSILTKNDYENDGLKLEKEYIFNGKVSLFDEIDKKTKNENIKYSSIFTILGFFLGILFMFVINLFKFK